MTYLSQTKLTLLYGLCVATFLTLFLGISKVSAVYDTFDEYSVGDSLHIHDPWTVDGGAECGVVDSVAWAGNSVEIEKGQDTCRWTALSGQATQIGYYVYHDTGTGAYNRLYWGFGTSSSLQIRTSRDAGTVRVMYSYSATGSSTDVTFGGIVSTSTWQYLEIDRVGDTSEIQIKYDTNLLITLFGEGDSTNVYFGSWASGGSTAKTYIDQWSYTEVPTIDYDTVTVVDAPIEWEDVLVSVYTSDDLGIKRPPVCYVTMPERCLIKVFYTPDDIGNTLMSAYYENSGDTEYTVAEQQEDLPDQTQLIWYLETIPRALEQTDIYRVFSWDPASTTDSGKISAEFTINWAVSSSSDKVMTGIQRWFMGLFPFTPLGQLQTIIETKMTLLDDYDYAFYLDVNDILPSELDTATSGKLLTDSTLDYIPFYSYVYTLFRVIIYLFAFLFIGIEIYLVARSW